jgi:tetratricopeptide (TPR) repeat protein
VIGKQVAHFKILEKLGGGGMGVLYKAEDTKLLSTVALKFLPPELTTDEASRKRLEHEAQALAALDHPNICAVRSIHESPDGGVFMCMPCYEGETLAAKIADGPLPVREALRTAVAIASGLEYAHAHNIVHRDIKPNNVMVTADGTVKILDFGIAKLRSQTQVTGPGMTPGTVFYMSPEQLQGKKVDARSDVFALGAALYEMISGHLPFEADHRDAVGYRILHDDPEPLTKHRADIPKGLQEIIDKALQKNPSHRYHKAAQMKSDLERVLRGRQPHPAVRRALIITAAALAIGVAAWKLADILTPAVPTDKRVMVMPFASTGLDPSDQSTYDGLQETLTRGLMQLEQFDRSFWVVPPDEIRSRDLDNASEANGIFGVNLLVRGEVQHVNEQYVVELSLLDADTQSPLRAAEILYRPEQLTELQEGLLRNVVDLIGLRLPKGSLHKIAGGGTEAATAYESFLQGRGYLHDDESIALAVERFERATAIDSGYARAYCGLAESYWLSFETSGDSLFAERAEVSCRRALDIDDALSPAMVVLGVVCNGLDRHEEAIDLYRAALELNPVCWPAYKGIAQAYSRMGDDDKAEATYRKALEVRPDYWPIREDLGYFYYPLGRYEDAAEVFEELVEMTPGYYMSYNNLGGSYLSLGRMDKAKEHLETSFSIKRSFPACSNLGTMYYREGRYADAASMYEWAVEFDSPHRNHRAWGNLAQAYARVDTLRSKAGENYRIAIGMAEAERTQNPNDPILTAFLAGYYADVDDGVKARQRISQALKLAPKNPEVAFRCGHAYEKLDEREKALMWIGKSIEYGYAADEVQRDPELEELRRDPRFKLLLPDTGGEQ